MAKRLMLWFWLMLKGLPRCVVCLVIKAENDWCNMSQFLSFLVIVVTMWWCRRASIHVWGLWTPFPAAGPDARSQAQSYGWTSVHVHGLLQDVWTQRFHETPHAYSHRSAFSLLLYVYYWSRVRVLAETERMKYEKECEKIEKLQKMKINNEDIALYI